MDEPPDGIKYFSVGLAELRTERAKYLKQLGEKLNRLDLLMGGYRELLVDFVKQLEMRELEDEYIQRVNTFFDNLDELLKLSRELTEHLSAVWELETLRLDYETRVVKLLTELLEILEPEADFKTQEISEKRVELRELLKKLAEATRGLKGSWGTPLAQLNG
jgi:hypothetical protein